MGGGGEISTMIVSDSQYMILAEMDGGGYADNMHTIIHSTHIISSILSIRKDPQLMGNTKHII